MRDVKLRSGDGAELSVFTARPGSGDRSIVDGTGVVILPDIRGLGQPYVGLARRFAAEGMSAIAIDCFGRTAGPRDWRTPMDWEPHGAQITATGISADTAAAVGHLRSEAGGRCQSVFVLGFGLGGAHAWLQAASGLGLAGVVGFYARTGPPMPDGSPSPVERVEKFGCPLLGIFGGVDTAALPPALAGFEAALTRAKIAHSLVMYSRAGHGFFDRSPAAFLEAAADAWRRVLEFMRMASTGDVGGLVSYLEIGRPEPPPMPASPASQARPRRNSRAPSDGRYFPPPESQGGWRVATGRREAAGHGLDPDRLEEFGDWNASIQHRPPRPPSQFGVVVIHDGWIVYERYDRPETRGWPRWIASVGKSITSCQFGRWLDAGPRGEISTRLELDGPVYTSDYLPEGLPLSDERKAAISFHVATEGPDVAMWPTALRPGSGCGYPRSAPHTRSAFRTSGNGCGR